MKNKQEMNIQAWLFSNVLVERGRDIFPNSSIQLYNFSNKMQQSIARGGSNSTVTRVSLSLLVD